MNTEAWDKMSALEEQAESISMGPSTASPHQYISNRRRNKANQPKEAGLVIAAAASVENIKRVFPNFNLEQQAAKMTPVNRPLYKLVLSITDEGTQVEEHGLEEHLRSEHVTTIFVSGLDKPGIGKNTRSLAAIQDPLRTDYIKALIQAVTKGKYSVVELDQVKKRLTFPIKKKS
ncbi:MAG: hypothetical protein EOO60_04925 [Hymenobacter sp.]|nr:MAG: hypothetical protein EOO60_04925 [Hymenobacter sp.]